MRARGVVFALLITAAACSAPRKPAPAPPVPTTSAPTTPVASPLGCGHAAVGIERGTRDIRDPETSVLGAMRVRCTDDGWSAAAIACFAKLGPEDLARCALELPPDDRDRMFAALGTGNGDKAAIAIALARLSTLQVGIAACDRFVSTVALVLGCDAMPESTRAGLGAETADFWSLPTAKLSADAQARMSTVCGQSLAALEQQARDAGCMP